MLFVALRGTGKIYACNINPAGENHRHAAAKVVFFHQSGAERLFKKTVEGYFVVGNRHPLVRHNDIKKSGQFPSFNSRVIQVEGPWQIVNKDDLIRFFKTKFTFDLEYVKTLTCRQGKTRMEWAFSSFRCQAEIAHRMLRQQKYEADLSTYERKLWENVRAFYAVDPCE